MDEHLSPEQIRRLANYQLTGDALVKALAHVEECAECRGRISLPTRAEVLDQLFRDEETEEECAAGQNSLSDTGENSNPATEKRSVRTSWFERIKRIFVGKKYLWFFTN